jgi:hypothetical protein
MIVLHERFSYATIGERALVVALKKKTTVVAKDARLKQKNSGEAGNNCFHRGIISKLENTLTQHLQKVRAVSTVAHRLGHRFNLSGRDITGSIRDLLGTGDHQALPLL